MAKPIDTERRLVAIFAADVEGYSRLMGADEVGTLRDLTQRRAVLDGLIASHRGRIANTAGDSVLAEFGSAVDAVQCAVEAQAALAEANADLSPDRHINFRIGVHVGDVMIKGGDLFGDGVNIAARLQTLASAGGVCLSGVAHDQVRKILPFAFTDLGAQVVKNIEEPVRAFSVSVKGASAVAGTSNATMPLALPDKPSIAVLPFQNMSGDPEQDYFADGMVEDIITGLSRSKSLFVIARNSSFTYKGKAVDIKQVGRELGVRYVLEGSVRKAGNRIRITGQLIDTVSGAHIWADRFEGGDGDVFNLQDQVTANVVGAISPTLERAEIERSRRVPIEHLHAYDFYLRGISCLYGFSRKSNEEALQFFLKAANLDSEFARAIARAANCYVQRKTSGWSVDQKSDAAQAEVLARRALDLTKDDATVLTHSGVALALMAGKIEEGAGYLTKATVLDPNLAAAWWWAGWLQIYLGEDASEKFHRAIRLSPLDPLIFIAYNGLAHSCFFAGRYDEASAWAETARRENPNFVGIRRIVMACHALSGRVAEAREACAGAMELDPTQRISKIRDRQSLQKDEDVARLAEAFRIAGMPE